MLELQIELEDLRQEFVNAHGVKKVNAKADLDDALQILEAYAKAVGSSSLLKVKTTDHVSLLMNMHVKSCNI